MKTSRSMFLCVSTCIILYPRAIAGHEQKYLFGLTSKNVARPFFIAEVTNRKQIAICESLLGYGRRFGTVFVHLYQYYFKINLKNPLILSMLPCLAELLFKRM